MSMEVTLIRHLATPGNLEKRFIGTTDPDLYPQAAKDLLEHYPEVDLVYVSPMKRTCQTAKLVYPGKELLVEKGLREMDFGDFEGKNYDDLNGNPIYQEWIDTEGKTTFPNAEPREEFIDRVEKAFENIIRDARRKNAEKIALVVHGGTIMALLDRLSEPHKDYYTWMCGNGAGYHCVFQDGKLEQVCALC
jgi:alpha-ribazole phosphatase